MATFTNQATLSYNNTVTRSNIVTGELVDILAVAKTAVTDTYGCDTCVTYTVSIVNSGAAAFAGLTVTDDLGAYAFGEGTVTPLEYRAGSLKYYVNGLLQTTPTVTAGPPMTVTGISVPAGGNALLVYQVHTNDYAPRAVEDSIVNRATVTGEGLPAAVTAAARVGAPEWAAHLYVPDRELRQRSRGRNGCGDRRRRVQPDSAESLRHLQRNRMDCRDGLHL